MLSDNYILQISANNVAWYGAIVATVSLLISGYNIFRDRAKVKIKYEPNQNLVGNGASALYDETKTYLCIRVINEGRRPIKINQASLKIYGKTGFYILVDSFVHHRIKVITEESPETSFFVDQSLFDLNKIIYVVVIDGTGKKYIKYLKKFPSVWLFVDWIKNKFVK